MAKEIFQPLGMTNSTVFEIGKEINSRAYGYLVKDTLVTAKDQSITSAIQGDGGIILLFPTITSGTKHFIQIKSFPNLN